MNESRIRIFSAAKIMLPNGHELEIAEATDNVFDLTISDPSVRIAIEEEAGPKTNKHYVPLRDLISAWWRARAHE